MKKVGTTYRGDLDTSTDIWESKSCTHVLGDLQKALTHSGNT
jgi:hypothetical protein